MDSQEIQIVTGEEVKQQISPEELEQLADLFLEEMFEPVEISTAETRAALEKAFNVTPGSMTNDELQERNKALHRTDLKEDLSEALEKGDLVIARRSGNIIGMIRVAKVSSVAPNPYIQAGGEAYEIGKTVVVPEERGNKVYKQLRQQILDHVLRKYGEVPVLTCTKNPAVKHLAEKSGAQEIGMEAYQRIHGAPEAYIERVREKDKRDGWTAFLYIPKKQAMG